MAFPLPVEMPISDCAQGGQTHVDSAGLQEMQWSCASFTHNTESGKHLGDRRGQRRAAEAGGRDLVLHMRRTEAEEALSRNVIK